MPTSCCLAQMLVQCRRLHENTARNPEDQRPSICGRIGLRESGGQASLIGQEYGERKWKTSKGFISGELRRRPAGIRARESGPPSVPHDAPSSRPSANARSLSSTLRQADAVFALPDVSPTLSYRDEDCGEETANLGLGTIIEDVNDRLASLERMLEDFVNTQTRHSSNGSPSVSSGGQTLSTPRDNQLVWRDLDYEGDSSFSAHSKDITQVIETGLKTSPDADSIGDIAAVVATLRSVLNEKPASFDASAPLPNTVRDVVDYPELKDLTLPPMSAVLSLLRYAKTHPLKYLNDVPNLTLAKLTSLCQKVYFPAEEFTIATFITVHVCLLNLFRELSQSELRDLDLSGAERDRTVAICLKNAETAIRNMRLYMQPTYENIEALVQGSTLAMDLSQASLAWTLITSATRMALDAGYHRLPAYAVAPEATEKRRLFWFLYCVERGMALNLGRTPSIPDYDILTDRPKFPEEVHGVWGSMFNSWFDFAKVQGDIYDQLYSAQAQKQSTEVKAELARKLAARLQVIRKSFMFDDSQLADEPFGAFLKQGLLSVEIVQYSTLCLVYRMIPPAPSAGGGGGAPVVVHPLKFCDEAIETARKALTTHNKAWTILHTRSKEEWRMFIHWTLLWCPFIPYIVLVGTVIADRNVDDLRLLERCVDTLHSAAQLSASVSKLYRACRIFYQIAKTYMSHPVESGPLAAAAAAAAPHGQYDTATAAAAARASAVVPSNTSPQAQYTTYAPDLASDIDLPDFPLSQEDWNGMLDEWDLGLGAENAREMSAFFEQYLSGSNAGAATRPEYMLPGNMP
ncbi:fungal specific transcription factor domain protein [Cladophialophora carrionii]|uniref:Fungal specific transcription factor domain protein n=1 Tax=Cladophialophora carrionii TaxID=86049 RepID=A0A1C1CK43_9EURO|nr:fungal specific transcription factor domain protein [Cladophialophora carrionii]